MGLPILLPPVTFPLVAADADGTHLLLSEQDYGRKEVGEM